MIILKLLQFPHKNLSTTLNHASFGDKYHPFKQRSSLLNHSYLPHFFSIYSLIVLYYFSQAISSVSTLKSLLFSSSMNSSFLCSFLCISITKFCSFYNPHAYVNLIQLQKLKYLVIISLTTVSYYCTFPVELKNNQLLI